MFTNELNMSLLLWACIEKTIHAIETHWFSYKEKVLGSEISKEGHADKSSGTWKVS